MGHVNKWHRALVNNPIKESFCGKRKKIINVLTAFFISHKISVKTFLKQIINQCPKRTYQHDLLFFQVWVQLIECHYSYGQMEDINLSHFCLFFVHKKYIIFINHNKMKLFDCSCHHLPPPPLIFQFVLILHV